MSGAEDTLQSPALSVATGGAAAAAVARPRGRLFRKYALLVIALVGTALLINSAFDFWFSYQENKAALIRVQQEKGDAAAARIEEFVDEIERQIGWTTHAQWASGPLDQRRQDYFRLLRQVPAITELSQLDAEGREQLKVSRLSMDVVGSAADFSQSPAFTQAKAHRIWFSPVYFRKESEPYMTLAIERDGRNAGVTIAEINLKLIWDVITALKIGEGGYAYVVDRAGRLIAHPDISLVLRDTDLSKLPQVAAALGSEPEPEPGAGPRDKAPAVTVATNLAGRSVLTAHAAIAPLGWRVFVEVPLAEAFAPLYGAALRTALLLAVGLIAATLVALVLARRMTGPIRAIAEGAERIGAGEFERRIDIHTGDELEGLAEQFNRMGADLQKSYAELEQRVEERTAELSESLDQQTATAEVLQVINASPGDLAPVFDAILEKALHLCDAAFGGLIAFDGETLQLRAQRNMSPQFAELLRHEIAENSAETIIGRVFRTREMVHLADIRTGWAFRQGAPLAIAAVELAEIRTVLWVPLVKDDASLGVITIYRREILPFTDKQIALLQNFAAQAVIAMENARLITETQEALEQQTATAEVLGVINSSPGDLAPVFQAVVERAVQLCEADEAAVRTFDGEWLHLVAAQGEPGAFDQLQQLGPSRPDGLYGPIAHGERVTHIADVRETDAFRTNQRARERLELRNIRSWLAVALQTDGALLGVINVHRHAVRPFSDKQIALLQNFAAQAVIAMENARLITETQEALEQQTATAEVLQVINSSPGDLAPVFEAMLDKAHTLCAADYGALLTYDGDRFWPVAGRGGSARFAEIAGDGGIRSPPGGALWKLTRGDPFAQIDDVADFAAQHPDEPMLRALVEVGGIRTQLVVPLRKDGVLLGALTANRYEVRPFSDKQIALLQNFAAQAVIAMENARLITETREALDQQTATAEVLGVINSSPGDLAPVFDAILEKAHLLCGAAKGALVTYDGQHFHTLATRGLSERYAAILREVRDNPVGSPPQRLVAGEPIVQIADFGTLDFQIPRAAAELEGARTALFVSLRKDGALLGYITAYRQEVRPFSDKEIALLENFAAQAVIAIENARLLGELRARTDELGRSVEELQALGEVGQAVSSTLDLRAVLVTILNRSVALAGSDAGAIFRYSQAERSFRFVEAVGYTEAMVRDVRALDVGENVTGMGTAIANRAPLQIPDLRERPPNPLRDQALAAGYRSVLIVPLVGADRVLGATILQRRVVGEFPEATVRLMQALASQSVLAIQNARLFREIAEKSEELRQASEHKSQFLANMSHELRTPLNAILGYTELMADGIYGELAPRAAGVLERVQNNGKHLLALINDVLDLAKIEAGQLTLTLEDYALPDVVQSVVSATEGLANAKGIALSAEIMAGLPTGHGDARRLAQVLLNLVGNAVKFTDTGEVAIGAAADKGNFVLTVRDTGPGIAPEDHDKIFGEFQQIDSSNTRKKGGTGLGLAISKRMVEMQGGTISVDSELGHGATFRVTLPIRVEDMPDELTGELMGAA